MLGLLSACPLDPELLHARFEGGGLHAEELGGSTITADPPLVCSPFRLLTVGT